MYTCINKCWHRGRIWNRGDEYTPTKEELITDEEGKNKIPHHFKNLDVKDLPPEPTPKLGSKIAKKKENPSLKAPAKDAAKTAGE